MRVSVTGGRGFIGKKLVEALLARGDEVRILTRQKKSVDWPNVDIVEGDLTSYGTDLAAFLDNTDVLYHCAGEINDAMRMRDVHVLGTERLIKAAQGRVGRWVQLSSVGAYGAARSGKITEDSPELPIGEYERTKTESDALVRSAGASGYFSQVVLRPSIVYGPSMPNRSLFQLIGAVDRGLFFFIGELGASANYIHVDNVVQALLACGNNPKASERTYIISDHCTIEDFIASIAKALGRSTPRLRLPEVVARAAVRLGNIIPGFPLTDGRVNALTNFAWYSDERIIRETGYRRVISIESGIKQMVEKWQQIKKSRL